MALTKTPKEILFTEPIKETFNPPAPMEEREGPKSELWCDFHEAYGHDTNDCKSLMREIISKIKAGELNHLLPGKRYRRNDPNKRFAWQEKGKNGGRRKDKAGRNQYGERVDEPERTPEKVIRMIWNEEQDFKEQSVTDEEAWMYVPIIFNTKPRWHLSEEPIVISATIANRVVQGVYVDNGSEVDLLYLHCFESFPFSVQRAMQKTEARIVGITGAAAQAHGKIRLAITLGTYPSVRTESITFTVIGGKSGFNALLGRRSLRKFGAIPSTVHAEMRFPTPKGIGVVTSEYKTPTKIASVLEAGGNCGGQGRFMQSESSEVAGSSEGNGGFPERKKQGEDSEIAYIY